MNFNDNDCDQADGSRVANNGYPNDRPWRATLLGVAVHICEASRLYDW